MNFVDLSKPREWTDALRSQTKAFYVESMTNPLLQVGALDEVPAFCRSHGLVSLIDNTFATPVNFTPLTHGFDICLHSATKYLNGHSDIVAGAIVGSGALVEKAHHRLNHLGGSLDPHACFLLQRGLKTLTLRVTRQNENAQALAEFLADREEVERVNYPGLPDHPGYQRAKALFKGCGGVLSFELRGGERAAEAFLDRLSLPVNAASLGGVETLVTRPSRSSHSGVSREERLKIGISDSLIRLAVGIENIDDLIEDFSRALETREVYK